MDNKYGPVKVTRGVSRADMAEVEPLLAREFDAYMPDSFAYIAPLTDWSLSFKAATASRIVGVYAIGTRQVTDYVPDLPETQYRKRRGVEGVALAVDPQYRGSGIGKRLIEAPASLGVDYIWGTAYAALGNLGQWLKRRRLVAVQDGEWITVQDFKEPVREAAAPRHIPQPDDITCGPAVISMVAGALGIATDVRQAAELCGTNDTEGTTDIMLLRGLAVLGIPHTVGRSRDTAGLIVSLKMGHWLIVRTLTRGVKHWILVHAWDHGKFQVNDPWLGQLEYTPEELEAVWKPRDFYYVEVTPH